MGSFGHLGIVGVGNMGYHFAKRMLDHGHKLVIYDKNQTALSSFIDYDNAYIVNSPREVADLAEIVFVSLPTPPIVKAVINGENSLKWARKIEIFVDLSTTGQKVAIENANSLQEKGIKVLDSPVSGGIQGAEKGSLAIMASGKKEVFEYVLPILELLGKNIFYVGEEIGQGQIVKLLNNLLSGTAVAITSEAVVFGQKAGIDPEVLITIFNASSGRNTATTDKFPKSVLPRTFDYGFTTELMYKDLKLCMELAENNRVPMFLGSSVMQLWKYVVTKGGEKRDFTTIIQYLEDMVDIPNEMNRKKNEEQNVNSKIGD